MRNTFYVSKGNEKATCDFYCLSLAIKTFLRRVKRKVIFCIYAMYIYTDQRKPFKFYIVYIYIYFLISKLSTHNE